jgi:threonine dehydrogenase-like Zn-dependent dehydrogenase
MRAAVVTSPGEIKVREVPLPHPGPGEVRVRVESCGVCASNLSPWAGAPWFEYPMKPGALGHEASGIIDALGEGVAGWRVGDRVAMLSYHAYAEFDLAAADAVIALPSELDGVPFPGEPLGCAMNIFARSGIAAGQTVAIVGSVFLARCSRNSPSGPERACWRLPAALSRSRLPATQVPRRSSRWKTTTRSSSACGNSPENVFAT